MAIENVALIHDPSAKTAFFDLKNRVVTLPILKEMSGFMYDAFIAHEISHALHTPYTDDKTWKSQLKSICEDPKLALIFVNITEDARIEKLIQRRYPGTRKDFFQFYQKLSSKECDFFGLDAIGRDLTKLTLIDRINVHFKLGMFLNVPFSAEEQVFVDMVAAEETWEDALEAARKIMEHMKQTGEVRTVSRATMNASGEGEGEDGNGEYQEGTESDSGEDGEGQSEQSGNDSGDGDEKSGNKSGNSGNKTDQRGKTKPLDVNDGKDGKAKIDPKTGKMDAGGTQSNFNSNSNSLFQAPKNGISHGDFRMEQEVFEKWKKQSKIKRFEELVNSPSKKSSGGEYSMFIQEIQPTVNMMVAQFNMRKSAKDYQKTKIAKTGKLDTKNLAHYRISDDIFLKSNVIHDSKNHGLIMFVDWSGSMRSRIHETIKQTLIMTEFCRKLSIPFEVYGFTSNEYSSDGFGSNRKAIPGTITSAGNPGNIFMILSSVLKTEQYRNVSNKLFTHTKSDPDAIKDMGGTPLFDVCFQSVNIVNDFKKRSKREKIIYIMLSDGHPTDNIFSGDKFAERKIYMRNPATGENYEFDYTISATHDILKYIKDVCGISSMVSFFITDKVTDDDYSCFDLGKDKSIGLDNSKGDINHSLVRDGYHVIKNGIAFDKTYVVNINKFSSASTKDSGAMNKITATASDNVIQRSIAAAMGAKTKNMIFMKSFIEEIG